MTSLLLRCKKNLSRPFPELLVYLQEKIVSLCWRLYLRRAGTGFHVCRGALIQGGKSVRIGRGFYAGKMLWIEAVHEYRGQFFSPLIEIGDGVLCSQNVHIAATERVSIGDGVLLGSHVHVTDHGHGSYRGETHDSPEIPPAMRPLSSGRPVRIGSNVWLGDGVIVLPGVTIGDGCIVGANSVVSRNLEPRVIAVGSPAVPVKYFDEKSGLWLGFE